VSRLRSTSTKPRVGVGRPGSSTGREEGGGRLATSKARNSKGGGEAGERRVVCINIIKRKGREQHL